VPLLQTGIEVDETQIDDDGMWRQPESAGTKQG
jgi:hypothetical protein